MVEGPAGLNSLVEITDEIAGINCQNGGTKITSGVDKNNNNTLDVAEIISTKFVCNGSDGFASLLTSENEAPGTNCLTGGIKILFGRDLDGDNTLDENEIEQTRFVCSGMNGMNGLIISTSESPGTNCPMGGVKVLSGKDLNTNGVLDTSEIEQTKFVCNGKDGNGNKEIRFVLDGICVNQGYPYPPSVPFVRRTQLVQFDVLNYSGYDSIVYVLDNLYVKTFPDAQPSSRNATIELVDFLTGNPISNSQIISGTAGLIISKNVFGNLPASPIDIGIRISVDDDSYYSCVSNIYMVLIKK
jgi:hypothetical protein